MSFIDIDDDFGIYSNDGPIFMKCSQYGFDNDDANDELFDDSTNKRIK